MSARDDYPNLHYHTSGPHYQGRRHIEAQAALDEIDQLRAEMKATEAEWGVVPTPVFELRKAFKLRKAEQP